MAQATIKNEEWIKDYRDTGNEDVREHLFTVNDRLCGHVASKYQNTGYVFDDLMSCARYGMLKAFNTFKLYKGIKFATYASRCMHNEILMMLRRNEKHKVLVSIDSPINRDVDGNELTLLDVIEDGSSNDINRLHQRRDIKLLLSSIKEKIKLTEIEQAILDNNMLDEPLTQKELGTELEISQSYVSRVDTKLTKKIRKLAVTLNLIDDEAHQARKKGRKPYVKRKKPDSSESTKPIIEAPPVIIYNNNSLQKDKGAGNMSKQVRTKPLGEVARRVLYFYLNHDGMKQTEIARELGVTQGGVSTALKAIKGMSKEELAKQVPIAPGEVTEEQMKQQDDPFLSDSEIKDLTKVKNTGVYKPEIPKEKLPRTMVKTDVSPDILDAINGIIEADNPVSTITPAIELVPKTVIELNLSDVTAETIESILHNMALPKKKTYRVAVAITEQ